MNHLRLHQWVSKRLDSIEVRPGMWGPPIAVECQYLLLLEMRLALIHGELEAEDEIRAMRRKWSDVIHHDGYNPSIALSDQVDMLDHGYDILVEALKKLRAEYTP